MSSPVAMTKACRLLSTCMRTRLPFSASRGVSSSSTGVLPKSLHPGTEESVNHIHKLDAASMEFIKKLMTENLPARKSEGTLVLQGFTIGLSFATIMFYHRR